MGMFDTQLRRSSVKFPTPGTSVTGTVTEVRIAPVPEFEGNRMVGPRVDLEGNVVNQVDVGLRVEGGDELILHTGGAIHTAIHKALMAAKLTDLTVGDTLTVTYTGDGKPQAEGLNPPKLYTAEVVGGAGAKPAKG